MNLTREEFEDRYTSGRLSVALVGMSNIGKTFTAMRLAAKFRFHRIEVDKLIWEELGHDDMDALAEWQGQPYSDGYAEREKHLLSLETSVTRSAMETEAENPLLDTTGSVIYTGEAVLHTLRSRFYVVHIEADASDLERLKALYFTRPKPLVWAGHFQAQDGRSHEESALECYPSLLEARESAYGALAHKSLSSSFVLDPRTDASDLFEALKPAH